MIFWLLMSRLLLFVIQSPNFVSGIHLLNIMHFFTCWIDVVAGNIDDIYNYDFYYLCLWCYFYHESRTSNLIRMNRIFFLIKKFANNVDSSCFHFCLVTFEYREASRKTKNIIATFEQINIIVRIKIKKTMVFY